MGKTRLPCRLGTRLSRVLKISTMSYQKPFSILELPFFIRYSVPLRNNLTKTELNWIICGYLTIIPRANGGVRLFPYGTAFSQIVFNYQISITWHEQLSSMYFTVILSYRNVSNLNYYYLEFTSYNLTHDTKHRIVTANAWSDFVVLRLRVTYRVKFGLKRNFNYCTCVSKFTEDRSNIK